MPKSYSLREDYVKIGINGSSAPFLSFNLKPDEDTNKMNNGDAEYWLRQYDENGAEYYYNEVTSLHDKVLISF
jgi:hypothetical protein